MDDIATLQAKYGITPKVDNAEVNTNRLSKLDSVWGPKPEVKQDQGSFYGGGKNSIGQNLIDNVNEGAADYSKDGMGVKQFLGPTKAVVRGVGDVAGGVFHPIGSAIDKLTGGKLTEAFGSIANSKPSEGSIMDKVTNIPAVQDFVMKHPNMSEDFQRALNIIFLGSADVAEPGVDTLGERTKPQIEAVKNAPETVINKAGAVGDKISETAGNIKNKISGVKDNAGDILPGGKTKADVLATPEENLHKLSPSERKVYFDNQQDLINQKSTEVQTKTKADLEETTTKLQTQAEDLSKEVSTASRDKVLELRPKIRTALGEQSQEYRRLVDEELVPHKDVEVSQKELKSFIENKYVNNPEQGQAMINKLGIVDEATPGFPDKPTTIGEIYNKTKSLGQDIGTAVKKGTRVFTPGEVMTDNAISTLTEFMRSKGVDLKAAREFWAKYAPVRNQLVTESKPFLQSGTQTKTFANTLTRVAKGTDVNNENFVSKVEDLVGEPITKETRDVLQKLSENEKQQLAAKADADTKIEEARLQKDLESGKLSDKQFKTEQAAVRRKAVITAIKAIGAIAGYDVLKKYMPILP